MKKKKHIVLARNRRVSEQGIDLDGQHMKFTQGSALWVADEGKARALQQKYPKDIAITEDQQYTWAANNDFGNGTQMNNIHKYTFSGIDMKQRGGGERVKVKTADGYTFVSREVAEEEGLTIIPNRRRNVARKGAEVKHGINTV